VNGWPPLAGAPAAAAVAEPEATAAPLVATLALAFLGGLLLNLMPVRVPGAVAEGARASPATGTIAGSSSPGGLAYSVGVVLSFLALAGAMLAVSRRRRPARLGLPAAVAALRRRPSRCCFALIGLNLIGLFELPACCRARSLPRECAIRCSITG
jgi:thiol:disulfide interchange protein DsbD